MLRALLRAAKHALGGGAPLDLIKIVIRNERDIETAKEAFAEARAGHPDKSPVRAHWLSNLKFWAKAAAKRTPRELANNESARPSAEGDEASVASNATKSFDVFISYSRADQDIARSLASDLRASGLQVFLDTSEIGHGAAWLERLHEALERSRSVVPLYSPDFLQSRPCKWEFNIACARNIELDGEFIFPILVRDADLPIYMRALNYRDCRVSDVQKVRGVASELAMSLVKQP
jgi:hypothetical protein